MNFSALELKEYLKNEFAGKEMRQYGNWKDDVTKAIKSFLEEKSINTKDIYIAGYNLSGKTGAQTLYVYYEHSQLIFTVDAKKSKGEQKSRGFYHTYFEWLYKDFEVVFFKEDFESSLEDAKKRYAAVTETQNLMKSRATELYKFATEKFGEDAKPVISYLNYYFWTIKDEVKE